MLIASAICPHATHHRGSVKRKGRMDIRPLTFLPKTRIRSWEARPRGRSQVSYQARLQIPRLRHSRSGRIVLEFVQSLRVGSNDCSLGNRALQADSSPSPAPTTIVRRGRALELAPSIAGILSGGALHISHLRIEEEIDYSQYSDRHLLHVTLSGRTSRSAGRVGRGDWIKAPDRPGSISFRGQILGSWPWPRWLQPELRKAPAIV